MRRVLLVPLLMSCALGMGALALPAGAAAHGGSHHARFQAKRGHHRGHADRRTIVFAPSGSGEAPAGGETLATIASFEGGKLVLTLPDGSSVSGKVTEQTWISCGCPGHEGWWGHSGPLSQGPGPGGYFHRGDDERRFYGPASESSSCGTSSLVPGAKVKQAQLGVSGAGAVWESVDLAPSSAS